ncbi:MAG: hypothetical protein Q7R56_03765 [Nanoarchaeota archaeon]|nr:hypothetical protein [Nanoarchaeota archaeon]
MLLFVVACSSPQIPETNKFTLKIGEIAKYEDLSLKFLGVTEDSRCPLGVMCIQAGRVVTSFQVMIDGASSFLEFSTEGPTVIKKSTPADWDYYIWLNEVTPIRRQGEAIDPDEYVVALEITKGDEVNSP